MGAAIIDQPFDIGRQQRRQVRLAVTEDDGLGNELVEFELVLDGLRSDVLAAGRDDDLLFTVDDVDKTLVIDMGDVAGLELAVFEYLCGRLLVFEIAFHDLGALDQQLSILS